jgi:oligoribonuclease NrnB/cAMP/cGMP phosphodiesterase (DHH superfamily)
MPASAPMQKQVHIVSHGPHCLDGVAAAVAVARYHEGTAQVIPHFAGNNEVDRLLRSLTPEPGREAELWITDISWRDPETDAHLRSLAAAGLRIYWIDHHRTALERFGAGAVNVPFTDRILSEEYAASRLAYDYLARRLAAEGRSLPRFASLAPLIAMADDNDRWLHRVPGSRELAWVVRSLGAEAYEDLLGIDERITYSPRMRAARARVEAEIAHSLAVANASRSERRIGEVTLVSAVCDGHPSEIADAWGRQSRNAVFALYDAKSLAVSLRRSPDCRVDLSHVAGALGGGGHAAAAGCELPELRRALAEALGERVGKVLG